MGGAKWILGGLLICHTGKEEELVEEHRQQQKMWRNQELKLMLNKLQKVNGVFSEKLKENKIYIFITCWFEL